MDVNLSKLWEMLKDRRAWHAAGNGVTKSQTRLSEWRATFNRVYVSILTSQILLHPPSPFVPIHLSSMSVSLFLLSISKEGLSLALWPHHVFLSLLLTTFQTFWLWTSIISFDPGDFVLPALLCLECLSIGSLHGWALSLWESASISFFSKSSHLTAPSPNPTYILQSIAHSRVWFACLLSLTVGCERYLIRDLIPVLVHTRPLPRRGSGTWEVLAQSFHCCCCSVAKSCLTHCNSMDNSFIRIQFFCLCVFWTLFTRHPLGHLVSSLHTKFMLMNL